MKQPPDINDAATFFMIGMFSASIIAGMACGSAKVMFFMGLPAIAVAMACMWVDHWRPFKDDQS